MKIITPGHLPGNDVYKVSCRNCYTLFEFQAKEVQFVSDQRDGDYAKVRCPFAGCGHENYVQRKEGRPRFPIHGRSES